MIGVKATIFFDQQGYGWTESYYLAAAPTNFSVEQTKINNLLVKRLKCCGVQTTVNFVRLQDLSAKRHGETYRPAAAGTGFPSEDSDAPDTACLFRLFNATSTQSAPRYIRGIWDSAVIAGGQFNPASPWRSSMITGFGTQLVNDSWCWLGKDDATSARQPLATLVSDAGGHLILTAAANVFQPGDVGKTRKISVSGVQGATTANGTWVVKVTSQTSCTTLRQVLVNPYVSGSGYINYNVLQLIQIADYSVDRVVERKVGRPLFHSRGRSRGRKVTW